MPSPHVHTLRHIFQYEYEGGAQCSASRVVCRPSIPCRSVFRHILQYGNPMESVPMEANSCGTLKNFVELSPSIADLWYNACH